MTLNKLIHELVKYQEQYGEREVVIDGLAFMISKHESDRFTGVGKTSVETLTELYSDDDGSTIKEEKRRHLILTPYTIP